MLSADRAASCGRVREPLPPLLVPPAMIATTAMATHDRQRPRQARTPAGVGGLPARDAAAGGSPPEFALSLCEVEVAALVRLDGLSELWAAVQRGVVAAEALPLGRSQCDATLEDQCDPPLVDPALEARPTAYQRLVGDLDTARAQLVQLGG